MTDSEFSEEFSRLVRESGRWQDTRPDEMLMRWEQFVDECERGYSNDSVDYGNDLTVRDGLERAFGYPELQRFPELDELRGKVERIDKRFRILLIPDVFPRIPESEWWSRGVIRYGKKRFVDHFSQNYQSIAINLEIVE